MTDIYEVCLIENDERAAVARQKLLDRRKMQDEALTARQEREIEKRRQQAEEEEQAEAARLKAREFFAPILQQRRFNDELTTAMLWAILQHAAGLLALSDLDEPASLKVRRLGRLMDAQPIIF